MHESVEERILLAQIAEFLIAGIQFHLRQLTGLHQFSLNSNPAILHLSLQEPFQLISGGSVKILELSRASYRKMIQNLGWAAGYNVVAIPLAAGVLAPWGILLSPAVGAVLMSLSTIIVAINAQLLRAEKL